MGSTSLTTDAEGNVTSEMRYNPWGAVRYAWTSDLTPGLPSRYTFTAQYSYMDDPTTSASEGFGLMYYNARWLRSVPEAQRKGYDPQLGRFAQADSIIPGGIQGLDRYAYVNNNPLKYVDPSGHLMWIRKYRHENGHTAPAVGAGVIKVYLNEVLHLNARSLVMVLFSTPTVH